MESQREYENLVLEGGGVRGFAYCGAIHELQQEGLLSKFKRFAGTSIGAIFAALLAAEFTVSELMEIKDYLSFQSLTPGCCIPNIFNIWNYYGLHDMGSLEKQLKNILAKRVDPDITLKGLFEKTKKDLVIVSCCLNREEPVYFHHAVFPNVKLLDAMIASISVPFVFQPKEFSYFGTKDYYVDGGVVDNYPIWVFNDLNALYQNKLYGVDKESVDPHTLGLKLLGKNEENTTRVYTDRKPIGNVIKFGAQLVNTLMLQVERSNISPSYIKQTVVIPIGSVYFLDFHLSEEQKNTLIKSGEESIKKYFNVDDETKTDE